MDLPKGSSVVSLAVPKTKVISVNGAGQVFIDAIPVSLAELEAKLRDAKAINARPADRAEGGSGSLSTRRS